MHRIGTAALAFVVLAGAGLATLRAGGAHAQDPTAPTASLRCRVFKVDSEGATTWETSDHTTEIGQWVGQQESEGFQVDDVDFEVGQKATGYPQGYVQICVRPV